MLRLYISRKGTLTSHSRISICQRYHHRALQLTNHSTYNHSLSLQRAATFGFFEDRIGKVKVKGMVKQMFQEAKIEGNSINHSLHATALFDANVTEAIIQKRLGHLSTKALLRMYERMTPQQDLAVSKILHSDRKFTCKAATRCVSNGDIDYDSSFSHKNLQVFEEVDCSLIFFLWQGKNQS